MKGCKMLTIEQIREERLQKGVSQWRLAVLVNRSGPWLGLREAGYVQTKPEELEALSAALEKAEARKQKITDKDTSLIAKNEICSLLSPAFTTFIHNIIMKKSSRMDKFYSCC